MAVRAAKTIPPEGMPNPSALSMAFRPIATPTPAASPISDAMMPTTTASSSTEPSTCRLLAPSARSSPFSRARCATVIENVLKIMNAPTSSATTAKISMKVLKKAMALANWSCISLVTAAPVMASVPCGSAWRRLLTSCCCETPGLATNKMLVYFPGAVTSCCATGVVNSTTDAPPGLSAVPNAMTPTTWTRCGGPLTRTVVKSPTRRCPSAALFLSITTCPAARGACPATRCQGLSAATWFQLPPSVGAPLAGLPRAFPFFPISLV